IFANADGSMVLGGAFATLQPNPPLIVGGSFNTIGGVASRGGALLGDDGSVSSIFQPSPNGFVHALLVQADGKIVVAGDFTNIAGATRNRLARFNADYSLDTTFNPSGITSAINALAVQPDGKILAATNLLVRRINPDGSTDGSFTGGVTGSQRNFRQLAVQADGKILYLALSGSTQLSDVIGRWNADGTFDNTFFGVSSQTTSGVTTIQSFALQADGRLLVGGSFTGPIASIFPATGSVAIPRLIRLNANGTLDTTFNPAPDGAVSAPS